MDIFSEIKNKPTDTEAKTLIFNYDLVLFALESTPPLLFLLSIGASLINATLGIGIFVLFIGSYPTTAKAARFLVWNHINLYETITISDFCRVIENENFWEDESKKEKALSFAKRISIRKLTFFLKSEPKLQQDTLDLLETVCGTRDKNADLYA